MQRRKMLKAQRSPLGRFFPDWRQAKQPLQLLSSWSSKHPLPLRGKVSGIRTPASQKGNGVHTGGSRTMLCCAVLLYSSLLFSSCSTFSRSAEPRTDFFEALVVRVWGFSGGGGRSNQIRRGLQSGRCMPGARPSADWTSLTRTGRFVFFLHVSELRYWSQERQHGHAFPVQTGDNPIRFTLQSGGHRFN